MPAGGIEATRRIVDDDADVARARDDDARGRRLGLRGVARRRARLPAQGRGQAETLRAIRAVANGEAILGPAIAERCSATSRAAAADPADAFPQLTEREIDVLAAARRAAPTRRSPRTLFLSQKTVRNYVSDPRQAPGRRPRRGAARRTSGRPGRHERIAVSPLTL